MIWEIDVTTNGPDASGVNLRHEITHTLGIASVDSVQTKKRYRFEGLTRDQATRLADSLLCDPVNQTWAFGAGADQVVTTVPSDSTDGKSDGSVIVAAYIPKVMVVAYKLGVTNPESGSLMKAVADCGMKGLVAADSCAVYCFVGDVTEAELATIRDRLLVNKTVQMEVTESPATLVIGGVSGGMEIISIRDLNDEDLAALSTKHSLFLNLDEMRVIQRYYQELERDPTDVELETLAQVWSEHCGHKTIKARVIIDGQEKPPIMDRLKETVAKYGTNVVSAFDDNSGVIGFFEEWAICFKVETHNAPSALEPYGGANTGVGGVIRDPLGTGLGAEVIVTTDMFCFAPPDLPDEELPPGCLPPRYLFRRVVDGVRDYGNQIGTPTNNGSVHFHPDFRAKPTVLVGAGGIMPRKYSQKGEPRPGDKIVAIGGRTGRDGIHGATFSSGAMTATTIVSHSGAVQIGKPIEEHRTSKALLVCRDADLIIAVTDCGAGGFSCAIGEMG